MSHAMLPAKDEVVEGTLWQAKDEVGVALQSKESLAMAAPGGSVFRITEIHNRVMSP